MFTTSPNMFALLEDQEAEVVKPAEQISEKDWSHLPWEKQKKKKNQQQPPKQQKQESVKPNNRQMQAKPLILPEHLTRNQFPVRGPKAGEKKEQKKRNDGVAVVKEEEATPAELTLKEYEKQLLEKKAAASGASNNGGEKRLVDLSKEFECMKLVGKKKVESEKKENNRCAFDGRKKANNKTASMDGFFVPRHGQAGVSRNRTNVSAQVEVKAKADPEIKFEDREQFPSLTRNS